MTTPDPKTIRAAVDQLKVSATEVRPAAQQLADAMGEVAKTQAQIDRAEQVRSISASIVADLEPVQRDLEAKRARNATLRAKLEALKSQAKKG